MKKDLDLEIGDLVVYPSYGVGEIEKFDKYDIDGSPKYNNASVDAKDGEDSQGVSIINENGRRKITDHKVVDVVTFSFFLFFNFKVNRPPIQ